MLTPPTKPVLRNDKIVMAVSTGGLTGQASPLFNQTPTFPAEVYAGLPKILKEGCNAFSDRREKDVFLVSAIGVISGSMPSVYGIYDGAEVKANLFLFVVAPPASGKGAVSCARMLGVGIHKHKTETSDREKNEFDLRAAQARAEKQLILEQPPPYRCFFIPGNISSAAIIKSLKDNDGNGVIIETEADSLTGALKQDWGDFSDVLRKSFHHEVISSLRKTGERYEIEHPALSVVLAGTPGQVSKLIPNAENGLFSRFLFYRFQSEPEWRDVSPNSSRSSLNKVFGSLAEDVKQMALCLESSSGIEYTLTASQWRVFNQFCREWLEQSVDDTSKAISGTIYRLGLIIYRLSMVLSVLRCFETHSILSITKITCEDDVFSIAIELAKVLLEHSKLMFDTLPKSNRLVAMV